MQSIGVSLLHGWLYMSGVCFIYLLLMPRLGLSGKRRQIVFAGIAASAMALYLQTEPSNPHLYMFQVVPACLLCVMFLEELWLCVVYLAVVVSGGCLLYGFEEAAVTSAGAALLALTGIYYSRKLQWDSTWRLYLYSSASVLVYVGACAAAERIGGEDGLYRLPAAELAALFASMLLSSVVIPFIYQFLKHHAKLQRELILSEKYHSVGQMAASISHEIRNPLTTARGFLQLMNVDKLSKENFERYRQYAFEGLDHANNVITEYLNYTKPTAEQAKPLDVRHEIESVVQWLQPYSTQRNVSIVTHHMTDSGPIVFVQPKQFQQCMLNIMKNAIESMADGGLLTVHTRVAGDQAQILIRDTGTGMDSEQLKRIGRPYFSTKESGTGLGLMVVMSLVKAMDGKIIFRSKVNQGTICEIHLPLHEQG